MEKLIYKKLREIEQQEKIWILRTEMTDHKEKLTSRKKLQMATGKRILEGARDLIKILFICHGSV